MKKIGRGVSIIFYGLICHIYKLYIFVFFPQHSSSSSSSSYTHVSIILTNEKALQPTIKSLQAKYQSNPEVMNQKIAEIYQSNDVNPLAGCIPSLVQIPVFIGLYRAVLNLAKEDALDESFLFLPSLEGPTYGADPAHGSDWLFKNW